MKRELLYKKMRLEIVKDITKQKGNEEEKKVKEKANY